MPTFVFSYRQPVGSVPSPETTAQWWKWFEGMGDELVDLGKPVVERHSIGNCSPDDTELGGYSLIEAADMQEAEKIAAGCPQLNRRGGIEIGRLGVPGASADS